MVKIKMVSEIWDSEINMLECFTANDSGKSVVKLHKNSIFTGGEERPLTESVNEENRSGYVDLINLSNNNKEIKN